MKRKIYLSASLLAAVQLNAQITLTQSANAPASGDTRTYKYLDSTATLDLSAGMAKTWDYVNSITNSTNTSTATVQYTTASSVPGYTMFSGANVAAKDSSAFYISTSTSLSFLGMLFPTGNYIVLSNPMKLLQFPFTYLNYFSDNYLGTYYINGMGSLNVNGNINVVADAYGTVILPSNPNIYYSNVLRVVNSNTVVYTGTGTLSAFSSTIISNQYQYFKSGTKHPFLVIEYINENSMFGNNNMFHISCDASIPVGIQEINNNTPAVFIYPNPSNDVLNVQMNKTDYQTGKIFDIQGKLVKEFSINNQDEIQSININELNKGVYILKLENSKSGFSDISYKFIKE